MVLRLRKKKKEKKNTRPAAHWALATRSPLTVSNGEVDLAVDGVDEGAPFQRVHLALKVPADESLIVAAVCPLPHVPDHVVQP